MFKNIAVPIDLAHVETQIKALKVSTELARLYEAPVTLIGVTTTAPGAVAHTPEEFDQKLKAFANEQGEALGIKFLSHTSVSHDLTADLEKRLDKDLHDLNADLVVMASHAPGLRDYVFRSHSNTLATHTDLSVMIVR